MVLAALLMVSSPTVFAYGSLDYYYSSQIKTEHWESTTNIPWYIDEDAESEFYSSCQASFDNWENVTYTDITFQYQGTTTEVMDADDGINVVSFNSNYIGWGGTLGFTVNYVTESTGEIYGFDVIMNPGAKWSTDGSPGKREYEVEAVVTHELGHAQGLAHVVVAQATMYPFASMQDVGPATLEDDDLISHSLLYGNATFPGSYAQFQGSVLRGGTGNPVAGACVHSFPPDAQYYSDNITNVYTYSAGTYTLYVPAGDYLLRLDPLDGDPAAFDPSRINEVLIAIAETDFPAEWYNDGENNCEDNTTATEYSISASQIRTGFDFVTNENCGGQTDTIFVQSITVTRENKGPNWNGNAVVHIVNQNGADVANANVTGFFNAPNTDPKSGLTGSDGNASIDSDKTKTPPSDWCFEVTDVSLSGTVYDASRNVVTSACESGPVFKVEEYSVVPQDYILAQNYPNPFNPTTDISFALPTASHVTLTIYNMLGQQVAVLADGTYGAGQHTVTWDASDQASGIYLYRLTTGETTTARKMLLLK
jgi:hypothetical protein